MRIKDFLDQFDFVALKQDEDNEVVIELATGQKLDVLRVSSDVGTVYIEAEVTK